PLTIGRPAATLPTTPSRSHGCSRKRAQTCSTCRRGRRRAKHARCMAACTRRRLRTAFATKSASRRWRWALSSNLTMSTAFSWPDAPIFARWRDLIWLTRTGHCMPPRSSATATSVGRFSILPAKYSLSAIWPARRRWPPRPQRSVDERRGAVPRRELLPLCGQRAERSGGSRRRGGPQMSKTPLLDPESRLSDNHHESLRLWMRLFTCTLLIERRIRAKLRDEFAISLPRFDLMAQLERNPRGLRM